MALGKNFNVQKTLYI